MIVHEPRAAASKDGVRVTALIESETRPGLSGTLWFEYPFEMRDGATDRADAFAVAAVLPAMALGEDVRVRGELSPKLASNLPAFQDYFQAWLPELRKARILADRLSPVPTHADGLVTSSFSGGVDSFYSLLTHLPARGRDVALPVRRLMYIRGFDTKLSDQTTYEKAAVPFERMAAKLGIDLIRVRTNLRDLPLMRLVSWQMLHGTALAATALAIGPAVPVLLIAATHVDARVLCGSNEITDPLLSTEATQIVYDGAVRRVEKTSALAAMPEARELLRVCWVDPDGVMNCCRCQKCVRTMVSLEIDGRLGDFRTFARPRPALKRWVHKSENDLVLTRELKDHALAAGKTELAAEIAESIRRSERAGRFADRSADLMRLKGKLREHFRHAVFYAAKRLP